MMELFLTPKLAAQFVYIIGLMIALAYLAVLPKKSRDTKLVLAILVAWLVMSITVNAYEITHTHKLESGAGYSQSPAVANFLVFCRSVVQICLAMLIYRIGFTFAALEEKLTLTIASLLYVWIYVKWLMSYGDTGQLVAQAQVALRMNLILNAWLIVVGARKLWIARVRGRDFRSRQLVLMVFLTSVAVLVYGSANSVFNIWPFSAESRGLAPALMSVLIGGFLIIGYLLYGEERHSLLVKLVGFLMIAYIATFAVIVPVMRSDVGLRRDYIDPTGMASRAFTPDSLGGYTMEVKTPQWIEPGGEPHFIGDDAAVPVLSAFPFPFYGITYDSIWVGTNGSLSFGEEIDADHTFSEGKSFFDGIPSAMPYYADFLMASASAHVTIDAMPEQLVVTWENMSIFDLRESTVTLQAVLFPDGRIAYNYADVNTVPLLHYVGISPGGQAEPVDFSQQTLRGAAGAALFEFQNHRTSYRRFVHLVVVPVAKIGVFGLFLILVLSVVFFRAGILKPLGRVLVGMGAVEKGNLDAEVVISERNELGALADFFNRMTASLRQYSNRMEELVAQRTADLDDTIRDLDKTISELRTTQAQLIHQEKMASLGQLTAGIAHEIKNPLNFVNNFAEVNEELAQELREALANGEDVEDIIADLEQNAQVIAKHGKRADGIVHAMMQHATGGTGQHEPTDLNHLIAEHIDLAYHGKRAQLSDFNVSIQQNLSDEIGQVKVVPQEIGRVVLNLLGNAVDAVHEHASNINGEYTPTVTVTTRQVDSQVEIRVSDNGPGILPSIKEKIFEPFFTTKPTGQGSTGLGLSLSYDIITQGHGGTLMVESEEGEGATFIVMLPVSQPAIANTTV